MIVTMMVTVTVTVMVMVTVTGTLAVTVPVLLTLLLMVVTFDIPISQPIRATCEASLRICLVQGGVITDTHMSQCPPYGSIAYSLHTVTRRRGAI